MINHIWGRPKCGKKKKTLKSQVLNCEMNNFATGEAFIQGKFDYGETESLLR